MSMLEDRALLDVQFEVRIDSRSPHCRFPKPRDIDTRLGEHVLDRGAIVVS